MKFSEIKLSKEVLKALEEKGFEEASPIQEKTIPLVLEGKDVIGQAQTGTGKTGAFGIPIVEKVEVENKKLQHLILAPTRELAGQITKELKDYAKYKKCNVVEIYGGVSYDRQKRDLAKAPHIVVATVGRLADLIKQNKINLKYLKSFTLDEADEMLAIGFLKEIKEIISLIPDAAQRMMFTATMNKKVKDIAQQLSNSAIDVSVSSGLASTKNIEQKFYKVKESGKFKLLASLLDMTDAQQIVIFGKTKRRVDELSVALNDCKYQAGGLQGDMSQRERTSTMDRFKKKQLRILVATDVAARGIDVKELGLVVNFDLPDQVEYYTHRIGRTGRAGTKGVSVSFVRQEELEYIKHIADKTNSVITETQAPTSNDVREKNIGALIEKFKKTLNDSRIQKDDAVVKQLMEEFSLEDIAIIAAQLNVGNNKVNQVDLKGESAIRFKSGKVQRGNMRRGRSGGGRSSGGSRNRSGGGRSSGGSRNRSGGRSGGSGDGAKRGSSRPGSRERKRRSSK